MDKIKETFEELMYEKIDWKTFIGKDSKQNLEKEFKILDFGFKAGQKNTAEEIFNLAEKIPFRDFSEHNMDVWLGFIDKRKKFCE
ncbi:MAG TPA: hypothetical protein VMV95_03630 [Bacillota bacterium]|nr:hypothetical protein [Bacillota bacterium]